MKSTDCRNAFNSLATNFESETDPRETEINVNLLKFANEKLMKSHKINLVCGGFYLFGTTHFVERISSEFTEICLGNTYKIISSELIVWQILAIWNHSVEAESSG